MRGKFPGMHEPSRGYHGVRFYETFGDFGFTMKARMETLRTFGPAMSPISAWLLLQGLETLHVRMERHCENALAVATFLENHPRVALGELSRPARAQIPRSGEEIPAAGARAACSTSASRVESGGAAAGVKFIEAAAFMSHLANIGDAKTLIIHPASTTHRQMSEEEQAKAGVTPDMIRVSVGLETLDDILWDIDQALEAAAKAR